MCTELVVHIFTYFYSKSKDRNLADKYSSGVLAFIFGHELGHALVDNLNLAVLGKEEDAVDAMLCLRFFLSKHQKLYRRN